MNDGETIRQRRGGLSRPMVLVLGLTSGVMLGFLVALWLAALFDYAGPSLEEQVVQLPALSAQIGGGGEGGEEVTKIPSEGDQVPEPEQFEYSGEAWANFLGTIMATAQRRSDSVIHAATLFVTACAFLFGLFQVVIIWLGMTRVQELKEGLQDAAKEKDEKTERLVSQADSLRDDVARLRSEIEKIQCEELDPLRGRIGQQAVFQRRLTAEFFGPILVGTLNSLVEAKLLTIAEQRRLKRRLSEQEGLLYLGSPDLEERRKVLYRLRGAGGKDSIAPLKEMIANKQEGCDLRLLAQRALVEIEKRVG